MSQWRDQWNLASKLTPRRLANAARVYGSYHRSRLTRLPRHQGLPISLSIEPTTSCNLRCPECPSGLRAFTRPTGMLSESLFRQVIDELHPTLWYLLFYFQGEPYLNPNFLSTVRYAADRNIFTATSTNGHFLTDELARQTVQSGLDRLIISIDGTTQETYQQYRVGGKLEKVLEGTRRIVAWKKKLHSRTPHLIFQFLVVRPNEHQIPEVHALANQLEVDQVVLKSAQLYDYQNGSSLLPTQDQYARYRLGNDGKYRIKNDWENRCWKMWHSCVVTWDGKVVPCCFDKDAEHALGSVRSQSFEEIWRSEAYQHFREAVFRSRSEIDMCRNCTEGLSMSL
ncbi:radical SAM additional 4Fe4S-binding SPASM domain-containing protein [Catalinimonas alkaloidigena]|uniref:Radical SAM additional 4Fe4S-binding SPASM domain-containing protein n=1 Tax=Catalinimonas alkaloidigena TaxID=1075417 RepID=A0A1G9EX54_9BACT|nr:SPASM domain-containing protein [Catalinimonas alkaloidigena]SDK80756.1 radical SAM additional 4Fe4S-binding SPASM domain-containing protein [Catalinimonas alkaloidigena]